MRALAPDNSKVLQMAFKVFKYSKYNSLPEKKFLLYLLSGNNYNISHLTKITDPAIPPKKNCLFRQPPRGPQYSIEKNYVKRF